MRNDKTRGGSVVIITQVCALNIKWVVSYYW